MSAGGAPRAGRTRPLPWLGPAVVAGGLLPVAVMAWDLTTGGLGANPVQRAVLQSGLLALVLLVASLGCTPLRLATGWTWPVRIRRALGLLAFGYATLHVLLYVAVDQGLDLGVIVEDVLKRPFITVGFAAFVLLVPLAVTSTPDSVRRLGFVAWRRLHRLVYVAAVLAAVHFLWQVKKDAREPLAYLGVLALLLMLRFLWSRRRRRNRAAS